MTIASDIAPPVFVRERDLTGLSRLLDAVEMQHDVDALRGELERAVVLPAAAFPADVVTMGSIVTYRDDATGRTSTIRVVYPWDADPAEGRVSVLAPVATALLGLRTGATIAWTTSLGRRHVWTVIAVQPGDEPSS